MKKLTIIAAAALSAASVLAISACGSSSPSSSSSTGTSKSAASIVTTVVHGTLTVCTNPPYAPFESLNGTQVVGLDMDLTKAVADKLGLKFVPKNTDFSAIESGTALAAQQCDIVASGISINATRKAKFNFSLPYFNDEDAVLTKDTSITDAASLKGKKIVVQRGTTGEAWTKSQGLPYVETTDLGTQIKTLQAGQADAAITDAAVLQPYATGGYKIAFTIKNGEQFGFGVSKTNTALLNAVDDTLRTLNTNGTFKTLFTKYGIPTDAIPTYS